jgi:HJR/Mrr/RecB family endonuclease
MTARSSRNNRRKYANNTNDQVIFTLVILLTAILYTNHVGHFIKEHSILEFAYIALALLGLIFLIMALRKFTRLRAIQHRAYTLPSNMSGIEFERYIASLLPSQGYTHVQLTERYDLGIDIIAEKEGLLWGIQVKRYSAPVKLAAVRQAVAALKHYDCDQAMVITNSSFSPAARDLAASNSCVLIDGQQLMRWAKQIS